MKRILLFLGLLFGIYSVIIPNTIVPVPPVAAPVPHITSAFSAGKKAHDYAILHHITTNPRWIYVDFTIPSDKKRLFVVENDKIIYSTFVTHGAGSGRAPKPTQFSNQDGSHMSSIGVYITLPTYTGKHGLSRQVDGLESTNRNAQSRAIVIHSAGYIGDGKTGTSWGCFAVPLSSISAVLDYSKTGTIMTAYYPDKAWLANSKFLN